MHIQLIPILIQINSPMKKALLGLEHEGNLISNLSKVYIAKAYIGMKIPSKVNNDKVYSDMKISPKHTLI